ncbi:hypothetical protein [Bradyrhizobium sp. BWA-3-5]
MPRLSVDIDLTLLAGTVAR